MKHWNDAPDHCIPPALQLLDTDGNISDCLLLKIRDDTGAVIPHYEIKEKFVVIADKNGWYDKRIYSKTDAIQLLKDAIDWIEKNT